MASAASHRSTASISTNLQAPGQNAGQNFKQQRRMTSPSGSLNPPDGGRNTSSRPPSPLRNAFVLDSGTGIDPGSDDGSDEDEDDDRAKWQRSPSPASSVSHLAASFVQRVNNFVGGIGPKSPVMPTDAELEAEAEFERDQSRREAEAILTREAQQRKLVEERVLAMMETTRSLPPPPSRSQTTPNPPSPSNSQKETSWWSAAKNKLTPTKDKEPLTPAQQVILDAKSREKDKDKKGKGKEKEWPANAQGKYSDPAYANLNIPPVPVPRKPVPPSPSSPTPSRPSVSNMPPNLTPSPMRTTDTISSSPSREAPPVYAQFNGQGTLDVPGTLLTIAKRFEKLEKWTVGHVRALEERMNDVERWLVDKEKEKEEGAAAKDESKDESKQPDMQHELQYMREEVSELQGRVGELGREMAKLATAPSNLSTGPKAQVALITPPLHNISSVIVQNHTGSSITNTPHHPRLSSTTATNSTSPPLASKRTPSGTRLPYPQGDYTSPSDAFSPPSSPPGSINTSMRNSRRISIPGLPESGPLSAASSSIMSGSYSSTSSLGRTMSPTPMSAAARATSPTPSGSGLPAPKNSSQRQSSVSPTPRKRYTVALGGPLVPPDELSSNAAELPKWTGSSKVSGKSQSVTDSNFFSSSNSNDKRMDDDELENDFGDETIGKSAAARMASSATFASGKGAGDYKSAALASPPSLSNRRLRSQSAYGFSSIPGASNTTSAAVFNPPSVAPLRTIPKRRSMSTERLNAGSGGSYAGTGDGMVSGLGGGAKFVDPLILRKQSRDSLVKPIAMPKPVGKVPIGQLVAFFDQDKK